MSSFDPADREPTKTDAHAKARFLGVLNLSLSTICNSSIWLVLPLPGGGERWSAVTVPDVIPLDCADGSRLFLRSTIQFAYTDDPRFAGERKVSTHFYAHTVGAAESLKPQLYSWEWSAAVPRYPHLHVRRADPEFHGLGKLHIPTGRVFFEDVARFLITDHGAATKRGDWDDVLSASHRKVSSFASWGGGRRP